MKLKDLLAGLELLGGNADPEQEITGVSYDSRTTKPGDLFVAACPTPWSRPRAARWP